jgi:hypothetical protein
LGLILSATGGIPISAHDAQTLFPLIDQMERLIEPSAGFSVHAENQY